MTKIIAFSGRKQSGKGTSCRFLLENREALFRLPPADKPRHLVTAKVYSMAGPLKKVCVEVLGLRPEQVYGTDEEKNSPTQYRWEDLPHYDYIRQPAFEAAGAAADGDADCFEDYAAWLEAYDRHAERLLPKGVMTARQVLQEVGTGIFRRMWADVWNQACLREIRKDNCDVALIDDVRFPDEVAAVQTAGGRVIRLTRDVFEGQDQHASEKALDREVFDWGQFDAVVHNGDMTVDEQNRRVASLLGTWGSTTERMAA